MINIKTKMLKDNEKESYVRVLDKSKNSNNNEKLIVINHLINELRKNGLSDKLILSLISRNMEV